MTDFSVPTVDISAYVDPTGSPEGRRAAALAFDEAASTVGFVQVLGHGIPTEVTDAFAAALDSFFDLPPEVKKGYRTAPEVNRGYTPPKTESLSLSLGLAPSNRMHDFFEAFNVGRPTQTTPDSTCPSPTTPRTCGPERPPGSARRCRPTSTRPAGSRGR